METIETKVELILTFTDEQGNENIVKFTAPTVEMVLEKQGAWERANKKV